MTATRLDTEFANQTKLISGDADLVEKALDYIKGLAAHIASVKKESEIERANGNPRKNQGVGTYHFQK